MTIHDRIRQARERRGLSWTDLAKQLHISWQTVQAWERAKRPTRPHLDLLVTLAQRLEVSLDWLLTGIPAGTPGAKEHVFVPRLRWPDLPVPDPALLPIEQPGSLAVRCDWLAAHAIDPLRCAWLPMPDDAMAPSITAGAPLLACLGAEPGSGGVYLVAHDSVLEVRRLYFKIDGKIDAVADNTAFPLVTAAPPTLLLLGRIISATLQP